MYWDDLRPREREWLERSLGYVGRLVSEVGMSLERRREGLAAVDPDGQLTDVAFPEGGSTAKHAALLVCEQLTGRVRDGGIEAAGSGDAACGGTAHGAGRHGARADRLFSHADLESIVAALIEDYGERCGWRGALLEEDGAARLTDEVAALLRGLDLLREAPGGYRAMAAMARFAPEAPDVRGLGRPAGGPDDMV
jgi:hypothetical protein